MALSKLLLKKIFRRLMSFDPYLSRKKETEKKGQLRSIHLQLTERRQNTIRDPTHSSYEVRSSTSMRDVLPIGTILKLKGDEKH